MDSDDEDWSGAGTFNLATLPPVVALRRSHNYAELILPPRFSPWVEENKGSEKLAEQAYSLNFEAAEDFLDSILQNFGSSRISGAYVGFFQNPTFTLEQVKMLWERGHNNNMRSLFWGSEIPWREEILAIMVEDLVEQVNRSGPKNISVPLTLAGAYPHWNEENCYLLGGILHNNYTVDAFRSNFYVNEKVHIMANLAAN